MLADGVAPDKLYPLDLDRAFKKLDTIKSDIIWWTGGAQSQQLLASAEAPFGSFWNGRLTALEQTGVKVGVSWEQNITAADSLVVPKGAKNKDAAMKFIALATSAEGQAGIRSRDRLCADQCRLGGADGRGGPQDAARRAVGEPGQCRPEILGGEPRRDRRALVRLAGSVALSRVATCGHGEQRRDRREEESMALAIERPVERYRSAASRLRGIGYALPALLLILVFFVLPVTVALASQRAGTDARARQLCRACWAPPPICASSSTPSSCPLWSPCCRC